METSAPKRRKTSPQASLPINNNSEEHRGRTGNNDDSTIPTDHPPGETTARSNRPSFASPTRASLARHNPDVLRRKQPTASRTSRDPTSASHPASSDVSAIISAQLEEESAAKRRDEPSTRGQLVTSTERRSSRSPTRRLGGALAAKPKRSPFKLPPRPLPPPGPEDEEPLNPFFGRGLRRSLVASQSASANPEPELPPTPEHPDPVVSTPPSGIHNTPSKRPRRSKALGNKVATSPSKAPPVKAQPFTRPSSKMLQSKVVPPKAIEYNLRERRTSSRSPRVEEPLAAPQASSSRSGALPLPQVPHGRALRGLKPSGPQAEKEKQRDALLAEIAQLQADLKTLNAESQRLEAEGDFTSSKTTAKECNDTLDVLRRHLLPRNAEPKPEETDWLKAALDPISFLPFMKPTAARPDIFAASSQHTSKEADKPRPASHHPVPMTAEEELPFLQVFTPLSFTTRITFLPQVADGSSPLLQRHTISASSTTPPGLFTAQLEMDVDVATHAIQRLSVPRLDPSAAPELGPFIASMTSSSPPAATARSQGRGRPSAGKSLHNNIAVLSWAMGEWVRAATQRARFWRVLKEGLADKERMAEAVARARSRGRGRAQGSSSSSGRRRAAAVDPAAVGGGGDDEREGGERRRGAAGSDDDDGDASDFGDGGLLLSRAELLPYMGRTSMELGVPSPGAAGGEEEGAGHGCGGGGIEDFRLRVQWRIGFDWTGEAQSKVELLTGVPGKWRKADERGNLADIPGLFGKLVQGDESPSIAVRAIVALLAGDVG